MFNPQESQKQQSTTESEYDLRCRWLEEFESQSSNSVSDFTSSSQKDEEISVENISHCFDYQSE